MIFISVWGFWCVNNTKDPLNECPLLQQADTTQWGCCTFDKRVNLSRTVNRITALCTHTVVLGLTKGKPIHVIKAESVVEAETPSELSHLSRGGNGTNCCTLAFSGQSKCCCLIYKWEGEWRWAESKRFELPAHLLVRLLCFNKSKDFRALHPSFSGPASWRWWLPFPGGPSTKVVPVPGLRIMISETKEAGLT